MKCHHCGRHTLVHYNDVQSAEFSWCLKAQGWSKKRQIWRCPNCHGQAQDTLPSDLGVRCACHRDAIFQHPAVLSEQQHRHIHDMLDATVAALIQTGCIYIWHHVELGGNYPSSSPTKWDMTGEGSRVWSKLDFFRPSDDFTNRQWSEVVQHMPESCRLARLQNSSYSRAGTKASWMESLVGVVYAVGSGGMQLPHGNVLCVQLPNSSRVNANAYMDVLQKVWENLKCLGVPMPTFHATEAQALLYS